MSKAFAWSFSTLDAYETCPKRFFLTKIAKAYPEKVNQQMLDGQAFHRALELRVERHKTLPPNMQNCEPIVRKLEALAANGGSITAERKIGLTRNFEESEYFGKDVWLRAVIDCQVELPDGRSAMIVDWKTGKVKENYDQLAITAATKFALNPVLEKVMSAYFWFSENRITKETFVREDVPHIWSNILPRVIKIEKALEDNNFPAKPSGLCKQHCPCINCPENGNYQGG